MSRPDESDSAGRPLLFSPIRLRELELKNRIVIPPMCQYSAREGVVTDWHLVHLGRYAMGGAGLIFVEATAVEERGRISHGDTGLWRDDQAVALKRVTDFLKANGAIPGVQLAHAGSKGSVCFPWLGGGALDARDAANGSPPWQTVSSTAAPYNSTGPVPRALSTAEVTVFVAAWGSAARRAREAGFEAVEIHAGHGYMLHQFLSSVANQRTDEYGGDFEARTRVLREIVEAVRAQWPAGRPIFVRLSIVDDADPDWSFEDSIKLIAALKERGADVIDCSSGGIGRYMNATRGRNVVGYHVALAAQVRKASGMTCMAGGLITKAQQAEDILQAGHADLVAVAREALTDTNWALHAAAELGFDTVHGQWPAQQGFWLERRAQTAKSMSAGKTPG